MLRLLNHKLREVMIDACFFLRFSTELLIIYFYVHEICRFSQALIRLKFIGSMFEILVTNFIKSGSSFFIASCISKSLVRHYFLVCYYGQQLLTKGIHQNSAQLTGFVIQINLD